VLNAIKKAVDTRQPESGIIFHSDRGSQYASETVKSILRENNIIQSMSEGSSYANAMAESFFHTLKVEEVYQNYYEKRREAIDALFDYIETFYNKFRIHLKLGDSPIRFLKNI